MSRNQCEYGCHDFLLQLYAIYGRMHIGENKLWMPLLNQEPEPTKKGPAPQHCFFSIPPLDKLHYLIVVAAAGAEAALWEAPGRDHQPAQRGGHPPPLRELQLPGPEACGAGLLRREPLLHHEGHQVEDDRERAAGALWGGHCPRGPGHVQQARRVPQKGGK